MTTEEYVREVVMPNLDAVKAAPDSLAAAVNLVLSIDAVFGHLVLEKFPALALARELKNEDDLLRGALAAQNKGWGLVRDMAHSLKHGQLNRTKQTPRLVTSADAIHRDERRLRVQGVVRYDEAFATDLRERIFIAYGDGPGERAPVLDLAQASIDMITRELAGEDQQTVELADLKLSVWG